MKPPRAAAIYARISSDITGAGAGVARQVEDCRALADSLGWPVAEVYQDNDVSAYSGKRRPEYERMLADLADGVLDAVLVYHIDRLTRRPMDLEEFVALVDRAKVRHVKFVTGDADLYSGDGLMMARVMGAFAAKESADKSRRLRRKMDQLASEGKPTGGGNRPFGYAKDRMTVVPEEADIVRALVTRFLAGESLRSLASWLDQQGVLSVAGKPWSTTTLRSVLSSPRIAGLYEHRGQVIGAAAWPPIITEDEHRRVTAKFAARKASGRRTPQRYLLSGMLRCGKCGNRLYSVARKTTRRYVCSSGPDHRGCGRLTVVADPLERLVVDALLHRLDTAELADVLSGRSSADERSQALSRVVDEAQEQLEELAQAHGLRQITMREWMIARKHPEQRLQDAQRQLSRLTRSDSLNGLVGNGEQLGAAWSTLDLSRQNAIAAALIDHIVIEPGQPGARSLDRDRVHVVWRL